MATKNRVAGSASFCVAAMLMASCELPSSDNDTAAVVFPEYDLSVECATDPDATAQRNIALRGVQILRLHVSGPDYDQRSRVQIFPPDSDVNISGPQGENPRYTVRAADLRAGKPVGIDLVHGSLTVQQHDGVPPEVSVAPEPSVVPSDAPEQQWLAFALSCRHGSVSATPQPGR